MPAPPELARVGGLVRRVEVLREVVAQQVGDADRHVRVAAEVEVELEGVAQGGRPPAEEVEVGGVAEELVDVRQHDVGDEQLLGHAAGDEEQAERRQTRRQAARPALEVALHVAPAQDGAGDGAREEGDEGGVAQEAARGGHVAAVDVDHVAHGAERVERDAQRQQHVERRQVEVQAHPRAEAVERVEEEAAVLEVAEDGDVGDEDDGEDPAPAAERPGGRWRGAREQQAGDPVDDGGPDHDGHEAPVEPADEDPRGEHQEGEPPDRARQQPVHQQGDGQEGEQERVARELDADPLRRQHPISGGRAAGPRPRGSRRAAPRGCATTTACLSGMLRACARPPSRWPPLWG